MKKLALIFAGLLFASAAQGQTSGINIPGLPGATSVSPQDLVPLDQAATPSAAHPNGRATRSAPLSQLQTLILTGAPGADPTGMGDSTSAINAALAGANGRCVYLPAGTYLTTAQLTLSINNACLIGDGAVVGTVTSSQTVIKINSTTVDAVHVNANLANVRIANLTIDRVGTPVSGDGLFVDNGSLMTVQNVSVQNHFNGFSLGATSYSVCTHCTAQNNFNHGFRLFNSAAINTQQWYLENPLSQNNNGWGYFAQATATGSGLVFGSWTQPVSFANTLGGIGISGVASNGIFDLFLNHPVLSSDGNDEIQLALFGGGNIRISDAFVELAGQTSTGRGNATAASSVGHGIALLGTSAVAGSVLISGGQAYNNSQEGFLDNTQLQALSITGLQSISNSVSVSGAGININNSSTTATIVGSRSYDINFSTQTFGLLAANGGNVTLSGNNFNGNVTGSCSSTNASAFVAAANFDQDGSCGGVVSGKNSTFKTNTNGGIVQTWTQTVGGATTPSKFWRMLNNGTIQVLNNAFSSVLFTIADAGTVTVPTSGFEVGAPTGGDEGAGTINAQGAYYANGTIGVSCAANTVNLTTLTVTNGIVTHC